jgi:single-strand DNA-binding protein
MNSNVTITGNLVADPELRFTPSGVAVANFTIATTPRVFNKAKNEWEDGEALSLRCNLWKEAAENVTESLSKGMRVIATGKLKQRSWEDKEGKKRESTELEVDEIGPSLKYAHARVSKVKRGTMQGDAGPEAYKAGAVSDPWGNNNGPSF